MNSLTKTNKQANKNPKQTKTKENKTTHKKPKTTKKTTNKQKTQPNNKLALIWSILYINQIIYYNHWIQDVVKLSDGCLALRKK